MASRPALLRFCDHRQADGLRVSRANLGELDLPAVRCRRLVASPGRVRRRGVYCLCGDPAAGRVSSAGAGQPLHALPGSLRHCEGARHSAGSRRSTHVGKGRDVADVCIKKAAQRPCGAKGHIKIFGDRRVAVNRAGLDVKFYQLRIRVIPDLCDHRRSHRFSDHTLPRLPARSSAGWGRAPAASARRTCGVMRHQPALSDQPGVLQTETGVLVQRLERQACRVVRRLRVSRSLNGGGWATKGGLGIHTHRTTATATPIAAYSAYARGRLPYDSFHSKYVTRTPARRADAL